MNVLTIGLIGENISRSRLAAALEIMCAEAGLTLDFTPIDTEHDPEFDFDGCVDNLRSDGWDGVSVTHPFKPDAAHYAGTTMDADVAHLGASNLLKFRPRLSGWNTDYLGYIAAWRAVMGQTPPGSVAMAGAGGVARAIVPALLTLGADKVTLWDFNAAAAARLAAETGATAIPAEQAESAIRDATGLVNATPLGMGGHPGTAFDSALFGPQTWAFDAVYTPTDTTFLTDSAARGLKVLTGFDLFRFMALETFRIYTGITPDPVRILPALDPLRPKETS